MGKRGPRSTAEKAAANLPQRSLPAVPAWEKPRLSRAERVIRFVESLPITSGMCAGQRMRLRPWQKDIVRAVYRVGKKTRRRIVRTALVTMPRKQGKTALAAALALCHLLGPEAEPRGQIFSAASDRDQAAIIFREMEAMILAIPEFEARCNIKSFSKTIEDCKTGSVYQALSSDARKAHGLSPSFVVYDELAQSPTRHLWDNLSTGTGARKEPLCVVISTQSSDPNHVMSELVDYGKKLRAGVLQDASFHATIYEAPEDSDPWDEAVWHACNPALGDFRSLEEMRQFAEQAKRIPAKESTFRSLYLNQRVDAEQRFISSADWDLCGGAVDIESLRGRPCWAGLDLGSTQDLTSLVLYFPEDGGAIIPYFWVPGDRLDEREDRDRVPYRTWRQQGFIEATPGRATDRRAITLRLAEIAGKYDVLGVAFDRWRIEDLQKILEDEGIDVPLLPFGQGFKDMSPGVDALEAEILAGGLRHGGHPVLTWNCSNAVVVSDPAGNRKIAKDKCRERVDGLVALVMAVGLSKREKGPIQYDFDRPLVLSA